MLFQSTPSAWRETSRNFSCVSFVKAFQSTPSAWRETRFHCNLQVDVVFQSTPSAWRETSRYLAPAFQSSISIHSLRMEGDPGICFIIFASIVISIHSLRMEGDQSLKGNGFQLCRFQSTPSAWRETLPRSLYLRSHGISIHSLRMEGDTFYHQLSDLLFPFQSTPSAWRETFSTLHGYHRFLYFNPLPPHGGRRYVLLPFCFSPVISIHSLRMEGDQVDSVQN